MEKQRPGVVCKQFACNRAASDPVGTASTGPLYVSLILPPPFLFSCRGCITTMYSACPPRTFHAGRDSPLKHRVVSGAVSNINPMSMAGVSWSLCLPPTPKSVSSVPTIVSRGCQTPCYLLSGLLHYHMPKLQFKEIWDLTSVVCSNTTLLHQK